MLAGVVLVFLVLAARRWPVPLLSVLGSPLFHFGILLVALGHVGGLLVPKSWTEAVGVSENEYHVVAVVLGVPA